MSQIRKATYSLLLRAMARRAGELREQRDSARRCVTALGGDDVARFEPPFATGTLVVYERRKDRFDDVADKPRFALAAADPTWSTKSNEWCYGLIYVQHPESGGPSGGSSWSTPATELRLPCWPDEKLLAAQYHAKARVIAAEAELKTAKAESAALVTTLAMVDRASGGAS